MLFRSEKGSLCRNNTAIVGVGLGISHMTLSSFPLQSYDCLKPALLTDQNKQQELQMSKFLYL
jgi:hypothetical protein